MSLPLQAPFPWFGGKSRVAALVWSRFGDVKNYVEPFAGSLAVLLGRPGAPGIETVNDLDGFVANFWRATSRDPDAVAAAADWPVSEPDLSARHVWLVNHRADLTNRLCASPDYYDAQIAGWWVWGICSWIGSGWCSGTGPWTVQDGVLVKGDAGRGINRQLPHLGDAGRGINRKLPHLGDAGRGAVIREWFGALRDRLRDVRVCCGDWARVCTEAPTTKLGLTGVFLDPPYDGYDEAYSTGGGVSACVRRWAVEHGDDPKLRIALCGYEGEHAIPSSWECVPWKARGGYGGGRPTQAGANSSRERVWFSPGCLRPAAEDLPLLCHPATG